VSNRPTHEISELELRYSEGGLAEPFDIIEIALLRHVSARHQTENQLIAPHTPWEKRGTGSWKQVQAAIDSFSGPLWLNGCSTFHGLEDKVPEANLDEIPDSLKLIEVSDLTVKVAYEPGWQGRPGSRKVRGRFTYNRCQYLLAVTDPHVETPYLAGPDGDYSIGSAILCLSLSEPIYGFAFKLIATVITKDRPSRK
jgi:hypothetical protein